MPFLGQYDTRNSSKYSATPSSGYGSSRLPSAILDRFGGRKPAGFERQRDAYGGGFNGAKYRSSTLERPSNATAASSFKAGLANGISTTSGSYTPFGATNSVQTFRKDSSVDRLTSPGPLNGTLSTSNTNLSNINGFGSNNVDKKYKAASRSNSRSLFEAFANDPILNAKNTSKIDAYARKITETLARHGALQEPDARSNDSGFSESSNNAASSTTNANAQWRKRLEAEENEEKHLYLTKNSNLFMISRATSPQPDVDKQKRSRIAKTTDPFEFVVRRSRPPRLISTFVQTDLTPEFGELTLTQRKVMPSTTFDYYAMVKKSVELMPIDKFLRPEEDPEEAEEEFPCIGEKASMTQLLPGSTPMPKPPPTKTQDTQVQDSSEYEYETDDEDIEEAGDDNHVNGERNREWESCDVRAESILEDDDSDLDYIDDEYDDIAKRKTVQQQQQQKKKKKTFISGTIDIDVLLGTDSSRPSNHTNAFNVEASSHQNQDECHRNSVDFSAAKPSKELLSDETPWWLKSKSPLQCSPSDKSVIVTKDSYQEQEQQVDEEDGCDEVATDTPLENNTVTEDDPEGEGEGEWEWEEYDEEEPVEEEADEEEVMDHFEENEDYVPKVKPQDDIDVRAPWIAEGLMNFMPNIPKKRNPNLFEDDDADQEEGIREEQTEQGEEESLRNDQGYKEWLEESANLQQEVEDLLHDSEEDQVQTEDDTGENQHAGGMSKAQRLVHKMENSNGTDLKRILFSLKTIFQTDKNLVYDFVGAQGIPKLIDLSADHEGQMQNLILRALGQIMLYVDGMNGVMANPEAIQFLYKLISSTNHLVCKTAVKLLLVFVEYTENNCLILIQAINTVDKDLGLIPWTNVIKLLQQESGDVELCTFALSLINKTLYGIPDQDTFYDHSDYMEELDMEEVCKSLSGSSVNDTLMQQIQLYNVALKQEDGEPVTEDEISYLNEDATEMGLRTSLRKKSEIVSNHFNERKSMRYKTKKIADGEVDSTGDIVGVSIRDLEAVLLKHGLPTSASGEHLNSMALNDGFLDKARSAFVAKLSKGELPDHIQQQQQHQGAFQREGELRWEQILANFDRALVICDLDFSDLQEEEEHVTDNGTSEPRSNIPIPPPLPPAPLFDFNAPPVPPPAPPPIPNGLPPPMPAPPPLGEDGKPQLIAKKHKKTVKLFWKEIRDNPMLNLKGKTVWDDLPKADLDHAMLEYLFENRGKDIIIKENKQMLSSQREIVVLDHKRSNAINIGMTKLPPARVIKSAVLKMDASIMNREGVEKLLTMLPSDEEISRIQEAQEAQLDIPLGTAEQFLLTLASINCLEARLRLWAFKMEFEVTEREICEPLMDLKMGLESLMRNPTFKSILAVLLTVGNYLNGSQCKGFQLDYLAKVPEVKDTVHKHSLLYHMTYWVLEQTPNCSDMYSEMGPITRSSRTDFEDLERTLVRLESECKLAWDYLNVVTKQDIGNELELQIKNKMSDFLNDSAERIIVMNTVYKKVMQRFTNFLQWMGIPPHMQNDYKAHQVCKVLSEFSLEFRTTRERVIQTIEKKKAAREKKRLARIAENEALAHAKAALKDPSERRSSHRSHRRSQEVTEDHQLRALLGQNIDITENGTLRRKKKHSRSEKELTGQGEEFKRERRKSRRHRSSLMEGTLPMTEETLKSFTETEMERGLLETLMGVPDEGTLKRNKERRKSIKEKRRSNANNHELKRSRTRDVWAVMEEDNN